VTLTTECFNCSLPFCMVAKISAIISYLKYRLGETFVTIPMVCPVLASLLTYHLLPNLYNRQKNMVVSLARPLTKNGCAGQN
jgi:hypothetical protein